MRVLRFLAQLSELVAFPHTVFALPFAFLGVLEAAGGLPPLSTALWVLLAMVGARTAAMAFNRLVDLPFDAANPRTAQRPLPAGRLAKAHAWALVVAGAVVLVVAAGQLNPLCLALSPLALAWVLGYSYTKRFTAFSHLWLGMGLAMAPMGGWLAVTGSFALPPLVLAGAVAFWVAGFDILYSLQDLEFDRGAGLFSLPARFGVAAALGASRLSHALAATGFAAFAWLVGAGLWGGVAVGLACSLLVAQHLLLARGGLARIQTAFFTANGFLSLSMLGLFALDIITGR
ncbi:MAG: putative 4-hydroxybenzoate polyprenyltransferase [Thermoanaerobaculum sp.]|nr:putative 4-hydroxybenzoate polyprenyltransferase [Thermoanaerobaculum sp.]